jgi:hypothetical protein
MQTAAFSAIIDIEPVRIEEGDRVIYPTMYPDPATVVAAPAPPPRPDTPEPDRLVIHEGRVNLSDSSTDSEE